MKTYISIISLGLALAASQAAFAADKQAKGEIIAKKDLPASIASKSDKAPAKFPGIPSCAKGRKVMTWADVSEIPSDESSSGPDYPGTHKCKDAKTLYVCASFGKLSIRCE